MFKNAILYRATGHTSADAMNEALAAAPFAPCGPTQPRSSGWVPPRGEANGLLVEAVGGHWIIKLMTETRSVPAAAVKKALATKLDAIEKETGRRPRGKMAKEMKEEVTLALMPQAFPRQSGVMAWLSPGAGLLAVDASSQGRADDFASSLVSCAPGVKLTMIQTELSPTSCMSTWLSEQEPPEGFSIDRECELKQPDSEKAAVRYSRHTLDTDEVREHIRQGKVPTRLAMTWSGRVSFVLTDMMALKKIKLLDVAMESRESNTSGFDADVAIFTGEMSRLVPDLIESMGGEYQPF